MILFGIGTLAALILAWVWGSRGFFSAIVHMVCVVIAGAIAFGLWEVVGYALLDAAGTKKWLIDISWGMALALPFVVAVAVLRVVVDKLLPFNTDLDGTSNLVGGLACGLVAGIISAGVMTLTVTNCGIGTESLEYEMVEYETNGSMVKRDAFTTIYPRLTAGLYSYMSLNSLRSGTPMGVWRPDIAYEGSLLRNNFNAGTSRLAIAPSSFEFVKRYSVGMKATGKDVRSYLGQTQTATPFENGGSPISGSDTNHYLEGYVVKFKSSAREKDGSIIIGNSQVHLVIQAPDESQSRTVFPVAMISQAVVKEGDDTVKFWRWSFASSRMFVSSVGGADDPPMAFEFLVPKGWKALALSVKGVRVDLTNVADGKDYADPAKRLEAVKDYEVVALPQGAKAAPRRSFPPSDGAPLRTNAYTFDGSKSTSTDDAIAVSEALPFRLVLSADNKQGLSTSEGNFIEEGEAAYKNADIAVKGIDSKLQVRRIASDDFTKIVQVDISNTSAIAYSKSKVALQGVGPPVLVDNLGQRYSAIGYVYQDNTNTRIRITPGSTIGTIADLPEGGPSESRNDQKFILIYKVTTNTKLKTFEIGNSVIVKIEPNIEIKK